MAKEPTTNIIMKDELVHQIAQESGQSLKATEQVLKGLQQVVHNNLKQGNSVRIMGFITFEVRKYGERAFRPIRSETGEKVTIPERKRVACQVGTVLGRAAQQ